MKNKEKITLNLNVWLEKDKKTYIGMGLIMILIRIEALGSLRKAAFDLKMSYRAAWGKLKKAEKIIGEDLVQKDFVKGQKYKLSDFGKDIIKKFMSFYEKIETVSLKEANKIFDEKIDKAKRSLSETFE